MGETQTKPSSKIDRSSPEYRRAITESLRWDHDRREPYLLLPSGDRITPFRPGIAQNLADLFNSPEIGRRLYRLPWPMSLEWAEKFVTEDIEKSEGVLAELVESLPKAPEPLESDGGAGGGVAEGEGLHKAPGTRALEGMPFRSIRNAEGEIIGDIGLHPSPPENGEGETVWHLGYVLNSSATGRGLMSAAVAAVLAFAKEWMGLHRIEAIVENDNPGSIGVLLANGFERVEDIVTDWPEEKGGGKRYGARYIWKS